MMQVNWSTRLCTAQQILDKRQRSSKHPSKPTFAILIFHSESPHEHAMEHEIDGWIEQLSQCKQLTENDVKKLCDKVRQALQLTNRINYV
jgi:hypothetical protein